MTAAKAIEYRITRDLILRRQGRKWPQSHDWAEHVVSVLGAGTALLILGSLSPELLWIALGAGAVMALGTR